MKQKINARTGLTLTAQQDAENAVLAYFQEVKTSALADYSHPELAFQIESTSFKLQGERCAGRFYYRLTGKKPFLIAENGAKIEFNYKAATPIKGASKITAAKGHYTQTQNSKSATEIARMIYGNDKAAYRALRLQMVVDGESAKDACAVNSAIHALGRNLSDEFKAEVGVECERYEAAKNEADAFNLAEIKKTEARFTLPGFDGLEFETRMKESGKNAGRFETIETQTELCVVTGYFKTTKSAKQAATKKLLEMGAEATRGHVERALQARTETAEREAKKARQAQAEREAAERAESEQAEQTPAEPAEPRQKSPTAQSERAEIPMRRSDWQQAEGRAKRLAPKTVPGGKSRPPPFHASKTAKN